MLKLLIGISFLYCVSANKKSNLIEVNIKYFIENIKINLSRTLNKLEADNTISKRCLVSIRHTLEEAEKLKTWAIESK